MDLEGEKIKRDARIKAKQERIKNEIGMSAASEPEATKEEVKESK